jgi:hypothetical protein
MVFNMNFGEIIDTCHVKIYVIWVILSKNNKKNKTKQMGGGGAMGMALSSLPMALLSVL